jgi:hypothetical protein
VGWTNVKNRQTADKTGRQTNRRKIDRLTDGKTETQTDKPLLFINSVSKGGKAGRSEYLWLRLSMRV